MTKITKEAAKDAAEYAAAQMAYGEGAGVRRRHIQTAVQYKADRIPGYATAFARAEKTVDMSKAVKSAKRTGQARDISTAASKNIRAIARGDRNGMSTPVILTVVGITIAHQTGYDKKILAYGKRKTGDVRAWLKRKL